MAGVTGAPAYPGVSDDVLNLALECVSLSGLEVTDRLPRCSGLRALWASSFPRPNTA